MPEGLKIQVGADITQAQAALKTIVTDAEKATGKVSSAFAGIKTQIPKIKLDVDTSSFRASIFESANVSPKVKVGVDTKSFSSAIAETTGTIPHVKLKVDVDASSLKTVVQTFATQGPAFAGIGSSISGITKQLQGVGGAVEILENQFARLQKIAALPGLTFRQQERLQAMLSSTQSELIRTKRAADIAGTGLGKFSRSSSSATQATINLGRVIQDAPFGFLGIANNLNPLLESFQRLRTSTGSAGGVLKALGQSLIGAGGLGLAISVISTGLILFGDKLFGAGKAAKKTAEDADRLKQVLKDLDGTISERREIAVAGTADEIAKVQALSNAILDQTKSYGERNNALKQLQAINKSYFGDLTLEAASLAKLTGLVTEYTKAIIAEATVKAFADDIGKLNVEIARQTITLNKSAQGIEKYKKSLSGAGENINGVLTFTDKGTTSAQESERAINKQTSSYNKQKVVVDELKGKYTDFFGALQDAVNESLKLKPLVAGEVDTKKTDNSIKDTIARANKLSEAFKDVIDIKFTVTALDTEKEILQKAKEFLKKFDERQFTINITPELSGEDAINRIALLLKTLGQVKVVYDFPKIKEEDIERPPEIVLPVTFNFRKIGIGSNLFKDEIAKATALPEHKTQKEYEDYINLAALSGATLAAAEIARTNAEKLATAVNEGMANIASSGFASLGESLGAALSGGGIGDAFKAFASSIGDALQAMGKQIIGIGVAALLAKEALKTLFANPAIAIAAGIGLIAAGAALKNVLSGGIKGFAKGGLVSGPQLALIGEGSGTSRSNPEVVAPLDQLRSMLSDLGGGGSQRVLITGRLRGNDMLLQNARTSRSQRRTTGR